VSDPKTLEQFNAAWLKQMKEKDVELATLRARLALAEKCVEILRGAIEYSGRRGGAWHTDEGERAVAAYDANLKGGA